MAYNLKSLIKILQETLNPDVERWNFDHVKPQLISLLEIAASLKQILETPIMESSPETERLESEIRDATHEAEDIIESHMVDQIIPEGSSSKIHPPQILEQLIQKLHSVKELVMKIMDGNQISTSASASAVASSSPAKNTVVGLDQDLMQLMDRLTGHGRKLEIIPIVGMGGIGKTTLARTLYDDQAIVSHFDICGWTTISQDRNVRSILLSLLSCIYKDRITPDLLQEEDYELEDDIYKILYGRRYLIVLDDMWGAHSWDSIRKCFPSNDNRSRIVITSRDSNVGKYVVGSGSFQHEMNLLTKSQSWSLLAEKVFGKTECPVELQGVGRKIASDCRGLPLAIHVIGGLLSEAGRSTDVWERIAKDVRAAIAESDDEFSNILSLSYNHLPNHLKPCFLYMGAFPEDSKVGASRLIGLWVAEGFAEEADEAEGYLTALVERNLLTVRQNKYNGKPKSYGIHDLLRDLSIRKAKQEKFLHVTAPVPTRATLHGPRRLSAHLHLRFRHLSDFSFSTTRSFIWHDSNSFEFLSGFFRGSRLVRVLDVVGVSESLKFVPKILQLVNLRYLALSSSRSQILPTCEVSRFRNLQTLIVVGDMGVVDIPSEIWEMPELRCLKLKGSTMRYSGGRISSVRGKMQTISTLQLHMLLEIDFFTSFPNMRSLELDSVGYDSESALDLRHLHKLEKLVCSSRFPSTGHLLHNLRLPLTMRKLTLNKCAIPPEFMSTLAHQLLHLQVLRILGCVFMSEEVEEWEATEEDVFGSLQFLSLEDLDVARWRADETNFPVLRNLVIRRCWELEEIPSGIGEIQTLQLMELTHCSPCIVASAKQIQEVQQSDYDNYDLQLRIFPSGFN
ncbi:putative late blight resistance protein homolog R1A-10 [Salvia miltiorrhiza]|uniref:putative late blight resistance protein homolog R1A-10 n=1 Tax=Salvia miltiorrhiza TaxID=226208 RepID=UPI0025AB8C2F|nr:putative late blight resistance protein homolog R1A-10 [Salvia miltiorrhiza]